MIEGIVPPLVTPLIDRDTLDVNGLNRLLEHVIVGGAHGVFALGTTGEAPSLSYRLRRETIQRVCAQVAGRVPVLVGITDTSFVESVRLAQYAAEMGADALVLATPYYFPAGQTELERYIRELAKELPLPLVLYNMPSLTKVWFEVETLRRLSDIERIVGVKDSSGDLDYFERLCTLSEQRADWFYMMGPEHLLREAIELGGHGGVHGGANIYPKVFTAHYHALLAGDHERSQQYGDIIRELQAIYEIGKYASRFIKATKCALSLREICDDALAEPFDRFHTPERRRVATVLRQVDEKIAALEGA